ncbi:glycosyltransferase family 4 protein [Anaeromyxobacter sp. SG17]|uniref:glycosyltransferase family 4 protein n=1 Tax=Anaeromyxobacter sp. SG17 TaxID=2925405 RepID=UPI001F5ACABE|nr:glycosyltransferase family 4 protein [Anaeromyxobacter sp. SG17]
MRILLMSRRDLFTEPGGDTVQVAETARALRALGLVAEVSLDLCPPLGGVDVVHIFNVTRPDESLVQLRHAKRAGRTVALSPIFCPMTEFERASRPPLLRAILRRSEPPTIEYVKLLAKAVKNRRWTRGLTRVLLKGYRRALAELLSSADVLLPNSESELRRIHVWLPDARVDRPYCVIPNAVSDAFLVDPETVTPDPRFRDCILCVARIDAAKAQLTLVRALRHTGLSLVLAGKPGPNSASYFRRVVAEAGSDVHFLGYVPQAQLPSLYRSARVHVLASWMETTGLSSLEAAAMGCNLVITPNGDTVEYFASDATYCTAGDEGSLRSAILHAFESPRSYALRSRILAQCTWTNAAARTAAAYAAALEASGPDLRGDHRLERVPPIAS